MKPSDIKKLYYYGEAKSCDNCFYLVKRSKKWFTLSRCNKHPTWLTEDALKRCQYQEWMPNEKLVKKHGFGMEDDAY
jgi:hypothetical protein